MSKKELFGEAFVFSGKLWDLFISEQNPDKQSRLKELYVRSAIRSNRRLNDFQNSPEWRQ